MRVIESFKLLPYGFPSHEVNPAKKKEKSYCLAFCQAFYALWLNNGSVMPYKVANKFDMLRRISSGTQNPNDYKPFIYGFDNNDMPITKGYYNVNWDILKVAVKYKKAYLGIMEGIDFKIRATNQDVTAASTRRRMKAKAVAKTLVGGDIEQMSANMGIPAEPQDGMPQMQNMDEADHFQQLGAFKLRDEIAFEKFIDCTFDLMSNWGDRILNMVKQDLWDLGCACVQDYTDRNTQKVKVRYCDPANMVLRLRPDSTVLDGGEYVIMSIADLRNEILNNGEYVDEDALVAACNIYLGWMNNPNEFNREKLNDDLFSPAFRRFWYDDWKVCVLKCEYKSQDQTYYTKEEKNGNVKIYRDAWGQEIKESPNKTTVKGSVANYYRASWVVGTEILYDYGLQFDQARPDNTDVRSTYHYVSLGMPSPVECAAPIIHQVQLTWLRFQNAWSKVKPDGYIYDESVLLNTSLGQSGKLKPMDMIKMANQTGDIIIKPTDSRNISTLSPNQGHPIMPFKGGLGTALEDFVGTWNTLNTMFLELTGMTPQAAAQAPAERVGKAVSEMAVQSTTNVYKPDIHALSTMKRETAENILMRGCILFKYSKEYANEYKGILGEEIVETLIETCKKGATNMGIALICTVDAETRMGILQDAVAAMQQNRDGASGITFPEYLKIRQMLENYGNVKDIQATLAKMITAREEKANKQKQMDIQAQGQEIQAQQNNATENKIKEMTAQGYIDIMVNQSKMKDMAEADIVSNLLTNVTTIMMPQEQPTASPTAQ